MGDKANKASQEIKGKIRIIAIAIPPSPECPALQA